MRSPTHHAPDTPVPGVTFVSDLDSGLVVAKAAAGDKDVNVLGADVARQCLDAGVLDEILVLLAPVLLGGNTRCARSGVSAEFIGKIDI